MSKSQKSRNELSKAVTSAPAPAAAPPAQTHAVRETVESIVIAFVLAFLFRTFEAEAFVIPTGSMAPTLMGRHKDVVCPKCGYRYQVSASEEESTDSLHKPSDCIAGMCPMCHYVLPMRPDLPADVPELSEGKIPVQASYNGDRILVNKYIYTFSDPQRWDVVVFKFPGDAKVNYIKRLVGLPGEKLRIYQGDVFIGKEGATQDKDFAIARKPPNKVLAMRQLVHDTNYDSAELFKLQWPLRWRPQAEQGVNAWKVKTSDNGRDVKQVYSVEASTDAVSWLRYEHIVPNYEVWQNASAATQADGQKKDDAIKRIKSLQSPRLITDSNPYDARIDKRTQIERAEHLQRIQKNELSTDTERREQLSEFIEDVSLPNSLEIDRVRQGINWVGDLMVEADIDVKTAAGQLELDLVKGGQHFGCTIDLAKGQAKLSVPNIANFSPTAQTRLSGPGKHHIMFANFDDQLLLWVDRAVVAFDVDTTYDPNRVFGDRRQIRPVTSDKDLGDLAPAGIGARGATLDVNRLKVWRDIYYIADSWDQRGRNNVSEFGHPLRPELHALPSSPKLFDRYLERKQVEFELNKDQLFVMGDNSAESSDARLWAAPGELGNRPGGPYLDRRLLIGKALCVYWPHSWDRIPGTPIPFPLFPNFADVRLVR